MAINKYFVLGYYGRGNFGDDFMLSSILNYLGSVDRVGVLCGDGSILIGRENTVLVKKSIKNLLIAVKQSDNVVQAGGTIFHDSYRGRSYTRYMLILTAYAAFFWFAKLTGKKVYMVGVGFGPLKSGFSRKIAKIALLACSKVVVRDAASQKEIKSLLGPRYTGKLYLGVDLTFLSHLNVEKARMRRVGGKVTIGLSACDLVPFLDGDDPNSLWVNLVSIVSNIQKAEVREVSIKLISLYEGDTSMPDSELFDRFLRESNLNNTSIVKYSGSVVAMNDEIGSCDYLIAAKFHAVVSAFLQGVPVLAISYNRKVQDFCEENSLDFLHLNDLCRDEVCIEAIGKLLKSECANNSEYLKKSKKRMRELMECIKSNG
ncbi:polysaccharide pyruvyl transferase family protein [Zhongshania marina]|uniref:Polysaccharide pyruvyl transferase domain-containing protein n=1 Tax=Zhongshania marina TaxID=2304603 RepID=A0ABX9W8T8_9GAMM|nr:hypothetical protein D0911_03040 [Zhongshania marina]